MAAPAPRLPPVAGAARLLCAGRVLELESAVVMGVLNVTPDSFSDGGLYLDPDTALAQAERMAEQGAAILDIGGESTRPGAAAPDSETEIQRVLPWWNAWPRD